MKFMFMTTDRPSAPFTRVRCLIFALTIITDVSDHPVSLSQTSGHIEVSGPCRDRRMTAELLHSLLTSDQTETPGYP